MQENSVSLNEISQLDVASHPRLSEYNRHVYPVVSRRAKGLSLGVNLNIDRKCNFNCVYCQVDRTTPLPKMSLNPDQINLELEAFLTELKKNNGLYQGHPLKDICIAGDGEPTIIKELPSIINHIISIKNKFNLVDCKLVLLTNGTQINRDDMMDIFPYFFQNNGEIWFKLDAWNEESKKQLNRSHVPFEKIIKNLIQVGKKFPIVLQSCFFEWENKPFDRTFYQPYKHLIKHLIDQQVHIKLLQLYTLARTPAEIEAKPWSDEVMKMIGEDLRKELPLNIELYFEKGKEK